ncbi:MAG: DNA polymerase III subunit beta [Selenomonadaceae bacterium]|nr:DNA polymerase III subunit beta [Selenomonadaceae bacterium]
MKFSCYKKDLVEALQFALYAVATKPQTPITAGIYLKAEGARLELQANDFSTGIITHIPVNVEESGATVVIGKRFVEFVRSMPNDTITFSEEGNSLKLSSGGASVELLTMAPEDFPTVKTPDADNEIKISAPTLRNLIRKTIYAATAKDESRPIFTGVLFQIDDDNITAVATNTHRLAFAKDTLDTPADKKEFVIPASTLNALVNRLDPKSHDIITVGYTNNTATFQLGDALMTSRIIEGTFPPYNKIFPAESATHVDVDADEFKRVINFIAVMAKEAEYNTVKLIIDEDGIEISANSQQVGDARQSVDAQVSGDDVAINFNVNYILDVLRVIDGKKIHLAFNDKFSPAKITDIDDDNFVYIVTPVRG